MANASELMEQNAKQAAAAYGCATCGDTILAEQTVQQCNSRTCTFTVNDASGLGLGRGYFSERPEAGLTIQGVQQELFAGTACCGVINDGTLPSRGGPIMQ